MRKIEYFYSAHSAYAYIGAGKLAAICADHGVCWIIAPLRCLPS